MRARIIKNDLNYILFAKDYLRFSDPKAQRKAFYLLECAIRHFASKGFGRVTLEMIAREAGVSRTLIKYYFKDVDEIELFALKHIRISAQKLAIEALEENCHPKEMLLAYVKACLFWAKKYRTHALVWLSFIHRCARNSDSRSLNSEAVAAGTDRIQSILEAGKAIGCFRCGDSAQTARSIQIMITGALCTIASENLPNENDFTDTIATQCLAIAENLAN